MPLLSSSQPIYIWSDWYSAQFRSRLHLCCLLIYTQIDTERNHNEAHHGKGSMDGIGGTIKNKVFQEVKSGRIVVDSSKDFAINASRLIQSSTTLYHPKDIFEEPTCTENVPYIRGTLDVQKVKRKRNDQGVIFLELYCLSFDEKPFYTHFYRKSSDPIICGHDSYEGNPDRCPHCLNGYHVGEEWMEYLVCEQ